MIRFNFLPWRDDERRQKKYLFNRQLLLSGVLGLTVGIVVWIVNETALQRQSDRNALLKSQISLLDVRLREIASLRHEIQALQARRSSVEALQRGRHQSVQLLQQLAIQIPEGVMLKSLVQGEQIQLSGYALSNARVSELLRNADPRQTRLPTAAPELVEIKSSSFGEGRDTRKLFEFTMVLPPAVAGARP